MKMFSRKRQNDGIIYEYGKNIKLWCYLVM